MVSQGLLFSEPSVAETGVWCALSEGIDPAKWADICRYIGTMNIKEFEFIYKRIRSFRNTGSTTVKRTECVTKTPLVSIGPSGIGGKFQREHF